MAESLKYSETGDQKTVQDLMEAMAKKKDFEEELKKIDSEGEQVAKQLNELLFAKMHMQESHGVQ